MSSRASRVQLDAVTAGAVRRLHKKYPKLGHKGLLKALQSEHIKIGRADAEAIRATEGVQA